MMKFLALAVLAILPACGDAEGAAGGGAGGLPSSTPGTVDGSDVVYVGEVTPTSTILPPTGTCTIPAAARSGIASMGISLPSPMRYLVSTSTLLWCTMGTPSGASNNIDFTKLGGLTCQELVSDVPEVAKVLSSTDGVSINECCEMVSSPAGGTGYVETAGISCGSGPRGLQVSGALCSITGEFMGWACPWAPPSAPSPPQQGTPGPM